MKKIISLAALWETCPRGIPMGSQESSLRIIAQVAAVLGLTLFGFAESVLTQQCTGLEVTIFSWPVALSPLLMGALTCGLVLGSLPCKSDRSTGPDTGLPARRVANRRDTTGVAGMGASALFLCTAHFPEHQWVFLLMGTLLAGTLLPRILSLLYAWLPTRLHILCFACAHGLGEMCAIVMASPATETVQTPIPLLSLLLCAQGGLLLLARHCGEAPHTFPPCPAQPPLSQERTLFLISLAALLFIVLHAAHDYNFRLYSFLHAGPPEKLRLAARLVFPVMALLSMAFGPKPLIIISVALSAFSPALDLFPGDTSAYWALYVIDTIGLHGGLFLFVILCGNMAWHSACPRLTRVIPHIFLYASFSALWYWHESLEPDPLHMMLASMLCLALLVILLALLLLPQQTAKLSPSVTPEQASLQRPVQATLTSQRTLNEEACRTLIANHGISNRESQILALICEGLSYTQMAERLFIAENTVKIHVSRILKKTNTRSRAQLMSKIFTASTQHEHI